MDKSKHWVIYRIHYGIDFLKQSIESVEDWADKIYICYSLFPWTRDTHVLYKGVNTTLSNPENVEDFLNNNFDNNKKIIFLNEEFDTPKHQFRKLFEKISNLEGYTPKTCLFIEPDMVFVKGDLHKLHDELAQENYDNISTRQVELWKNFNWRIPQRDRVGPTLWNIDKKSDFNTHFGTTSEDGKIVSSSRIVNYNFGFCIHKHTMLYKHLTALSFSAKIGDSLPCPDWYEDKWLNWSPETMNIEISLNYKHTIHKAIPYELDYNFKKQLGN